MTVSMPWERYDGTYTSGWGSKKKPTKKAAAKKTAKPARKRKPKGSK